MFWLLFLLSCFKFVLAVITSEASHSNHLEQFNYCMRQKQNPHISECVGQTALNFLQRLDEQENFTLSNGFIATKDEKLAERSLVNLFDIDPVDFRGIMENAGAVFIFEKIQGNAMLNTTRDSRNLLPDHSPIEKIANKLMQIVQSRSMSLKMPKLLTLLPSITSSISNSIDSFSINDSAMFDEGRKKKDKDKAIFIMGGMTILAMLAQMFLGKVLLIAGAAFVMAKIALISSFLGNIKKSIASHGAGSTEHIIYTSHDVGGQVHHDHSGWQRKAIKI